MANVGDLLRPSITREEKFKLLGEKLTLGGVGETLAEDYEAWFALNENSGVITLRRRVDREELCAKAELCVIRLKVMILDLRHFNRMITLGAYWVTNVSDSLC